MNAGLFFGVVLALFGAPASAPSGADELDVPFVAQTPLLCGGAAAAMVERYWGARGRSAEDYLPLVEPTEGGIRASELTSELREMGYLVHRSVGAPEAASRAISDGIPPIVLLGRDQGSFHYVVVTGMTPTEAIVHDPNFGPDRGIAIDDFMSRWAESDYWAIEVVPGERHHLSTSADDMEVSSADASSTESSSPLDPAVDSALVELREGRYDDAVRTATAIVRGPELYRPIGYRVLATGLYLRGDRSHALDAWNAIGTPVVDHVEVDGLSNTRFHVAAEQIAARTGALLTADALHLSERRLGALPSVDAARVDYRPNLDGSVEVEGFVLERGIAPSRTSLARSTANAIVNRRASLSVGALMASGDVWTVEGSWARAQRGLSASVATAGSGIPGVAHLSLGLVEERFRDEGAISAERRLSAATRLTDWVTPHLQLGLEVGLERWTTDALDGARVPALGAALLLASEQDDRWLAIEVDGWAEDGLLTRTSASFGLHVEPSARSAFRLRAGAISTSEGAPRLLWPGAGSGAIRDVPLRAHALDVSGAIAGPAFGRDLGHATAEVQLFERFGPARLGAVVFADAVALPSTTARDAARFLDYGVGAFADLGQDEITLALARGAPGWALSLRVDRWAPSL